MIIAILKSFKDFNHYIIFIFYLSGTRCRRQLSRCQCCLHSTRLTHGQLQSLLRQLRSRWTFSFRCWICDPFIENLYKLVLHFLQWALFTYKIYDKTYRFCKFCWNPSYWLGQTLRLFCYFAEVQFLGSANFAEIQAVGWAEPWGYGRGPGYRLRHHRVTFPWVQEQETEGESLNHKFWNGFQFSLLPPGEHQHSDEDGAEAGDGAHPQTHRGG